MALVRDRISHIITPQRRELLGGLLVLAAFIVLAIYAVRGIRAWIYHPFHPLNTYPISVQDSLLGFTAGQEVTVRNGICNSTSDVITVKVYVAMQRIDDGDPAIASNSIVDLLGDPANPQIISLFPGCVGTQPTKLLIPSYTPKGTYYIFVQAETEHGNKKQQEVLTSEQFQVR